MLRQDQEPSLCEERPASRTERRRHWSGLLLWGAVVVAVVVAGRRLMPDLALPDLGPAPRVAYADLDGTPHRLTDYRGDVVVLNVWATWCPPCIIETPGFVDLQHEFEGEVQFLGLSRDANAGGVRDFVQRHDVPYPVLIGPPQSGASLTVEVLPTTYVIGRRGRIRMRHEGLLLEPALRPVLRRLTNESP